MSYFTKKIKENEEIIRLLHYYPLTLFLPILTALALILTPFFLLYPLFQMGTRGMVVFFLLLFLGLLVIIKILVEWYYNLTIITNERVIIFQQKGFFEKDVNEVWYPKIQNVSCKIKGVFATFFNYGIIKIETVNENQENNLILKYIKNPQKIQDLIIQLHLQAIEQQKKKNMSVEFLTVEEIMERTPMQELFKVVKRVKEITGEVHFKKTFIEEEPEKEIGEM